MAEGQIKKGRTEDTVMELVFLFSGTAHQSSFHPLPLGKDLLLPWQGGRQLLRSRSKSPHCLPSPLLPQRPVLGAQTWLCPAFPCLALIYRGSLPRVPDTVGSLQGALQPQRASGTVRSCSSACCFGAARSQPAFDTSRCGPRKIFLQS